MRLFVFTILLMIGFVGLSQTDSLEVLIEYETIAVNDFNYNNPTQNWRRISGEIIEYKDGLVELRTSTIPLIKSDTITTPIYDVIYFRRKINPYFVGTVNRTIDNVDVDVVAWTGSDAAGHFIEISVMRPRNGEQMTYVIIHHDSETDETLVSVYAINEVIHLIRN